jgi:hypothetical protein
MVGSTAMTEVETQPLGEGSDAQQDGGQDAALLLAEVAALQVCTCHYVMLAFRSASTMRLSAPSCVHARGHFRACCTAP